MSPSSDQMNSARPRHAAASRQVEATIEARNIAYVFEPNLPIDQIREAEGNQVRLTAHRAPKEMVNRYAEQMRAGATFPAIVVSDQYELVDGNTRRMAALRNKREVISAYVCADLSALQARSLSVELNQSHGLSMTAAEIRAFVVSAVKDGHELDTTPLSRMTGVKASTLRRWVAATRSEMRAEREGVSAAQFSTLSESVQVALHVARLKSVFSAATELAVAAKVPASDIKAVITQANNARSEADALAIVEAERAARADTIAVIAAGFKVAKRRSNGAALHIGGLLRFEAEDLLDVDPDKQPAMFARMCLLRERLNAVVAQATAEWKLPDPSASEAEYTQVG